MQKALSAKSAAKSGGHTFIECFKKPILVTKEVGNGKSAIILLINGVLMSVFKKNCLALIIVQRDFIQQI